MYETTFRKDGDLLRVRITGERTREAVASVSKEIMETCLRKGTRKLLIDVRKFVGRLTLADDYQLPAKEFRTLPPHGGLLQAAAVLDLPENDARFALFEDAARSQGYNFRVFSEAERALKWLDEQDLKRV